MISLASFRHIIWITLCPYSRISWKRRGLLGLKYIVFAGILFLMWLSDLKGVLTHQWFFALLTDIIPLNLFFFLQGKPSVKTLSLYDAYRESSHPVCNWLALFIGKFIQMLLSYWWLEVGIIFLLYPHIALWALIGIFLLDALWLAHFYVIGEMLAKKGQYFYTVQFWCLLSAVLGILAGTHISMFRGGIWLILGYQIIWAVLTSWGIILALRHSSSDSVIFTNISYMFLFQRLPFSHLLAATIRTQKKFLSTLVSGISMGIVFFVEHLFMHPTLGFGLLNMLFLQLFLQPAAGIVESVRFFIYESHGRKIIASTLISIWSLSYLAGSMPLILSHTQPLPSSLFGLIINLLFTLALALYFLLFHPQTSAWISSGTSVVISAILQVINIAIFQHSGLVYLVPICECLIEIVILYYLCSDHARYQWSALALKNVQEI